MDLFLYDGDLRHERINRSFIQRVFYGLSYQMNDNTPAVFEPRFYLYCSLKQCGRHGVDGNS